MRIAVTADGGRYFFPLRSQLLIFRPLTGSARLYWREQDFAADAEMDQTDNFADLNGSSYAGEFRIPANVDSIWLRGEGAEVELTIIGQA